MTIRCRAAATVLSLLTFATASDAVPCTLPTGGERPYAKLTDDEEIGAPNPLADRSSHCAVGRQWPNDSDILRELTVRNGSGDDLFSHFAPASIEWNEAGDGGDFRQPLTIGEARSCARTIGCDRS